MARALARLGNDVTLLDGAPQVLPKEDADAAAIVGRRLAGDGIAIELGVKVARIRRHGDEVHVRIEAAGGAREMTCDRVGVATGRTPNIDVLGLPVAGVAFDAAGVIVDNRLRTSNRRIFAVGEVCSTFTFTHAADAMAHIAVQNALFFGRKR